MITQTDHCIMTYISYILSVLHTFNIQTSNETVNNHKFNKPQISELMLQHDA